jgi:hypothetical protein
MTYTIFMLVSRKPGMSLADFTHHYENIHIPLALDILGASAPISHTRYYLKRSPASPSSPSSTPATTTIDPLTADAAPGTEPPPLVFVGAAASIDYDCVSIVEFEDEAHFARFNELLGSGPRSAEMEKDNAGFVDMGSFRIFVVGEARVTKRER